MYAIVDIAGQQFKVEKDLKLYVHRLEGEEGNKVTFDRVLLVHSGDKTTVGNPVVRGASVTARIVSHVKGDKVLVFKKKRRKGYQTLNGHRQQFTEIQIETISEKKAAAKKEPQPEKKPSARKETAEKKEPAARKETAEKKEPAARKEAAAKKEPAARKEAATKKKGTDTEESKEEQN